MRDHSGEAGRCREAARKYLGCRMEADLMAKEDFKRLGLGKEGDPVSGERQKTDDGRADVRGGFVSGMKLAQRRKARGADSDAQAGGET